jgi:uncharacterized FlgJ-related protein
MKKIYFYNNKSLQFEEVTSYKKLKIVGLIFLIAFLSSFTTTFKLNRFVEKIPVIIKEDKQEFSQEWLENYLKSCNAQHIDILMAQAKHETGNFTSNIFKQNLNLFGMKKSYQRQTVNSGEQFGHAKYNSYEESVLDILLWQANYGKNLTRNQYLQLLKEVYAEDTFYLEKLKSIL